MLAWREQWAEFVPLHEEKLTEKHLDEVVRLRLEQALEAVICAGLTQLKEAFSTEMLHELAALAAEMSGSPAVGAEASPIAACLGRTLPPEARGIDHQHWLALVHLLVTPSGGTWRKVLGDKTLGFMIGKYEKERLKDVLDRLRNDTRLEGLLAGIKRLPPARYPEEQWQEAKALFRVLRRSLAELQVVFAEQGECDFTEAVLFAKYALRQEAGAGELTAALGMQLEHLLVDEMQDTSTSQYEVIQLLTQGWDGRSQTVFLVGDPKQSIYLFPAGAGGAVREDDAGRAVGAIFRWDACA